MKISKIGNKIFGWVLDLVLIAMIVVVGLILCVVVG